MNLRNVSRNLCLILPLSFKLYIQYHVQTHISRFGIVMNSTTIFILNLAFSDLLYCAINLPMYATQYLERIWPLGASLCYANAVFRYINAFSDWVSVGLIAVSRCICLLKPNWAERYLTKTNSVLVCILIWIYASFILVPLYTEVQT